MSLLNVGPNTRSNHVGVNQLGILSCSSNWPLLPGSTTIPLKPVSPEYDCVCVCCTNTCVNHILEVHTRARVGVQSNSCASPGLRETSCCEQNEHDIFLIDTRQSKVFRDEREFCALRSTPQLVSKMFC